MIFIPRGLIPLIKCSVLWHSTGNYGMWFYKLGFENMHTKILSEYKAIYVKVVLRDAVYDDVNSIYRLIIPEWNIFLTFTMTSL